MKTGCRGSQKNSSKEKEGNATTYGRRRDQRTNRKEAFFGYANTIQAWPTQQPVAPRGQKNLKNGSHETDRGRSPTAGAKGQLGHRIPVPGTKIVTLAVWGRGCAKTRASIRVRTGNGTGKFQLVTGSGEPDKDPIPQRTRPCAKRRVRKITATRLQCLAITQLNRQRRERPCWTPAEPAGWPGWTDYVIEKAAELSD